MKRTRPLYSFIQGCVVITAAACVGSAGAHPVSQSLRAEIDTEGEQNAYSEIYFSGDCANAPVRTARATFSGHSGHRTLMIANPCFGEWHTRGRRGALPGLALTPHPGDGHFAASIAFGAWGQDVGRHRYTLTVTYAGQRLTAMIMVIVTPGSGPGRRGYAIKIQPGRVSGYMIR